MLRTTAAILAVAAAVVACGVGPPDHVRLAVVAPLTGPRAYLGQEMAAGARLAVEDLNQGGGLLGAPVELEIVDDADLVELPGRLADLAELARVTAVIGPEAPGVLLGSRSPLSRREVPALLPTSFAGDLDGAATFVARTVPSARAQAEAVGRWLREARGIERIAMLIADPIEGDLVRDELRRGLEAVGVTIAAVRGADASSTRLGPAVRRLRSDAASAQAVWLWGPPPAAARATRAVRAEDWDVQIVVPSAAFVGEYRTLAGEASEGVVLPFPFRWEWFREDLTNWMLRYYRENGLGALPQLATLVLDVPVVAVATYDAIGVVADAVRQAGTREPAEVADALPDVRSEGLLRTYALGDHEAWSADDLFIARFHRFAATFDVDPRRDAGRQREFWRSQVTADFLPDRLLEGPAGDAIRELLSVPDEPPTYEPPLPAPQPVGRP